MSATAIAMQPAHASLATLAVTPFIIAYQPSYLLWRTSRNAQRLAPESRKMTNIRDFRRMFSYDDWANRQCLHAIQAAKPVSQETIGRMTHILAAQQLWLERILNQKQSLPVWPDLSIEECTELSNKVASAWRNYLSASKHTAKTLEATVDYRNSKGESWLSRVDDILTHVLFHSAYHRGQIALQLRASGAVPAYTDFIHAVRQGFVEAEEWT
jgi:uncharacterized damage-inducible protein DinB